MKLSKVIILNAVGICLFISILLLPVSSKSQSLDNLKWGAAVDGVEMSVSTAESGKANVPEFQVALRNVGEKDILLNLGTMLANGKVQEPTINFTLTDVNGKLHLFAFASVFMIAGRVDDYIVPLRAGSIYTLKLSSEYFLGNKEESFAKLPAGKYTITAQFEGDGAEIQSLNTYSWKGKLQSNPLIFEK